MPKAKPHKGLLKRVTITAKGKIKFKSSHSGHLRSNKTGKQVRAHRKLHVAKMGDVLHFQRMLHIRLEPVEKGPEVTPKKA